MNEIQKQLREALDRLIDQQPKTDGQSILVPDRHIVESNDFIPWVLIRSNITHSAISLGGESISIIGYEYAEYIIASLIVRYRYYRSEAELTRLKEIMSDYLDEQIPLPTILAQFIKDELNSSSPFKPKGKGRRKQSDFDRNKYKLATEAQRIADLADAPLRDSAEKEGTFAKVAKWRDVSEERVDAAYRYYRKEFKQLREAFDKLINQLPPTDRQAILDQQVKDREDFKSRGYGYIEPYIMP